MEEAAPQLRQDREARQLAPTGPVRNRTGKGVYRVISGSKLYQVFGRLCWAFHVQRSLVNLPDQDWVMKHSMPGSLGSLAQFQRLGSSATWAACCRPWPSDLLPSPNRMGRGHSSLFRFAAEELKRDRDIVLTAVRRSGLCLESLAQLFDMAVPKAFQKWIRSGHML